MTFSKHLPKRKRFFLKDNKIKIKINHCYYCQIYYTQLDIKAANLHAPLDKEKLFTSLNNLAFNGILYSSISFKNKQFHPTNKFSIFSKAKANTAFNDKNNVREPMYLIYKSVKLLDMPENPTMVDWEKDNLAKRIMIENDFNGLKKMENFIDQLFDKQTILLLINCKLRRSQSSLHTARRCIPNVPTYISIDHEHQNGITNSSLVGVIIGDWKFFFILKS
ncbi:hypothetical protein H8356DRAFT_1348131 [Neocallimastix lanati (nom. inval.)]|nr:hypothetical protein H8356DRAFT_1348131 [Neocallimastix sp. JGI-2020a]